MAGWVQSLRGDAGKAPARPVRDHDALRMGVVSAALLEGVEAGGVSGCDRLELFLVHELPHPALAFLDSDDVVAGLPSGFQC